MELLEVGLMAKASNRENAIFDKGYDAVRTMAKEMVENGATLSDILFHANQVWHEFKLGAAKAGLGNVATTGMYMDQYNADTTNEIIQADKRYSSGMDAARVKQFVENEEELLREPILVR